MFSDKNFGLNKSLLEAASTVLNEKKHHKGKHLDPVGKEDEDIDNDGDVDSSDRYLKNRRKAIAKNIKEEKAKEMSFPFPPASVKNAEIVKSMSEKPPKKPESQPKENMNESFFKVVGGALKGQKVKSIRRTSTGHDVKTKDGKVTHITHDNLRRVLKEDFFAEEAERVTYHKKMIKRIEKILEDDPDNEHYREKLNYHKKLLKKLLSENEEKLDEAKPITMAGAQEELDREKKREEKNRIEDAMRSSYKEMARSMKTPRPSSGYVQPEEPKKPKMSFSDHLNHYKETGEWNHAEAVEARRREHAGDLRSLNPHSSSYKENLKITKKLFSDDLDLAKKIKRMSQGKEPTIFGQFKKFIGLGEEFSEKEIEHIMNVLEVVNTREPDQTSPRQSGSSDRTNPTMPNNTLTDEVCKSCKSKKCKCH